MNPTALKFIEALKMQGRESTQDKDSVSCGALRLSILPSLDTDVVERLTLEFPPLDEQTENALYPTLLLTDLAGIRVDFLSIYAEFKKQKIYQGLVGDWNLKISPQGDRFLLEAW